MTVKREELVKIRKDLVKQMHDYILTNIQDEDIIINIWLACGVPDCPTEQDFEWFAEDDDEFTDLCRLFAKCCRLEEES